MPATAFLKRVPKKDTQHNISERKISSEADVYRTFGENFFGFPLFNATSAFNMCAF